MEAEDLRRICLPRSLAEQILSRIDQRNLCIVRFRKIFPLFFYTALPGKSPTMAVFGAVRVFIKDTRITITGMKPLRDAHADEKKEARLNKRLGKVFRGIARMFSTLAKRRASRYVRIYVTNDKPKHM